MVLGEWCWLCECSGGVVLVQELRWWYKSGVGGAGVVLVGKSLVTMAQTDLCSHSSLPLTIYRGDITA